MVVQCILTTEENTFKKYMASAAVVLLNEAIESEIFQVAFIM